MFRFTIRDVLWLMVVCAVIALAYSDRLKTQQRIAEAEVKQAQERAGLEQSQAELDQREAIVRAQENSALVMIKQVRDAQARWKEAQALDEDVRRRFPKLFDRSR